ncbi:MAG TPA: DUF3329 domain-containing protein [Mycobacterium sp.]|nr:DUF3329 domain-containing protein [Mycobacterium sp.]
MPEKTSDPDDDASTAQEVEAVEPQEPADSEQATEADESGEATEAATETDGEAPVTQAESRRPRRLLTWVLPVLLVAALAGAGYLGWLQWQTRQVAQASAQAQAAAVAYAQVLTSIDSNKVDENFQQVLDGATGEFKDMYSKSSVQLRQLLIDNKATAHGAVQESAVQSATKDKVVVLLFVDQSVQNSQVPDPRIDRSRIKMTMEKVDGKWRASKVELP